MKTLLFLILYLILCSFVPTDEGGFVITWPLIVGIITGIYEVLSRVIPSSHTWSIIGKVLEFLTWFSNLLDRKKK